MNASLPPELEFIVIEYLSADKPTLSSCSLVCWRWLPPSRRRLFQDITIKPAKHLNPTPLEDFLRIIQDSGDADPEWAIGPCIKTLTFDGSVWEGLTISPALICSLSFLSAFLPKLPRLTSLCLIHLLMPDDLAGDPTVEQPGRLGFKLNELVVSSCTAKDHDPHQLLALICMFSSIESLAVIFWGRFMADPIYELSLSTFSPPLVRSLTIEWAPEMVAPAIYALLADSPSVANGHLTHISLDMQSDTELLLLSEFASVAGAAFREVELRASSPLFTPSERKCRPS